MAVLAVDWLSPHANVYSCKIGLWWKIYLRVTVHVIHYRRCG